MNARWNGVAFSNGDPLAEGSTKTVNGRSYVLQSDRWLRNRVGDTAEHVTIKITGNEFGVNWKDKTTRKAIVPRLVGLYGGKAFRTRKTGQAIQVNRRAINEVLSHLPDARPAMVLAKLSQLLESMAWTHGSPPRSADPNIRRWHYFHADVLLGGALHDAEVKVREDANGNWFYDEHLMIV